MPLITAGAIAVLTRAKLAAQFGEHWLAEGRLEDRAAYVQGQERRQAVVGARIRALPGDDHHRGAELAGGGDQLQVLHEGRGKRLAVDGFRAHYLTVQLALGGRRSAESAKFVAGDRGGQRLLQQAFGQGVDRHRFGGGAVFQGGDQGFRKA